MTQRATNSRFWNFDGVVVRTTDKAMLINVDDKDIWFPKAIVEDHIDGTFTIPMEWALEKELVK